MGIWSKLFGTSGGQATHSEEKYHERDNRGDRQDDLGIAVAYWMQRMSLPFKDPYVVYTFTKEDDARAALLGLPCIKVAVDTGKLICTERLIFGHYRQQDGTYEAILCGSSLTQDLWAQAGEQFARHGGKRKNDLAPKDAG